MMNNFPQYPDYLVNFVLPTSTCGQLYWKDKVYMRAHSNGFIGSNTVTTRVETAVYRVLRVNHDE